VERGVGGGGGGSDGGLESDESVENSSIYRPSGMLWWCCILRQ